MIAHACEDGRGAAQGFQLILPEGSEPSNATKSGQARDNTTQKAMESIRSEDPNEGWTSQSQRCPKALDQTARRGVDEPEPTPPEGT